MVVVDFAMSPLNWVYDQFLPVSNLGSQLLEVSFPFIFTGREEKGSGAERLNSLFSMKSVAHAFPGLQDKMKLNISNYCTIF